MLHLLHATWFNFAGLAPPSSFFLFLPKDRSQRKGNPQRVEFPPLPCCPGRGRNLRRANRVAADSRPLNILSGTSVSACADGARSSWFCFGLRNKWGCFYSVCWERTGLGAAQSGVIAAIHHKLPTAPTPPHPPSSMPRGGAAAGLSGWLFERLDVSQSRVPAVPQQ